MEYETQIKFYNSEKGMQKGIAKEQKKGWEEFQTEH